MAPRTNPANVLPSRGASVITETAAPSLGTRAMTLDGMTIDEKQIAEHARRDAIQACVLLVSMKFGDKAGEWLRAELFRIAPDEGGLGEPARSNAPRGRRKRRSTRNANGSHVG